MQSVSSDAYPNPPSRALGTLGVIALVPLIVGGLNWALVGLFDVDLVAAIFGAGSMPTRAVYVIVGLAAVVALLQMPRMMRHIHTS